MRMRMEKRKDRIRNRFFRWVGLLPIDDFDWYADDVMKALETFETFTQRTALFASIVAKKLDIKNVGDEMDKMKEKTDSEQMGNMFY